MTIRPTIVAKVVFNDLDKLPDHLKAAARKVIDDTRRSIVVEIKAQMTAPKSGRSYRRGRVARRYAKTYKGTGIRSYTTTTGTQMAIIGAKLHRASAPGEAPARDYGNLINSLDTKREDMTGYIYTNADYAEPLETTKNRPFLAPAVRKFRDKFIGAMEAAIKGLGR